MKEAIGALLWWLVTPIRLLWAEIIGMRAEHIRSLSVVTGIVFLFRGYDHMGHGDPLTSPYVVVTLVCLVMSFGLAWQATRIKGKVAGLQLELGNTPTAAQSLQVEPVVAVTRHQINDPEGGP